MWHLSRRVLLTLSVASGPVVCMIWQGLDAVKTGRVMLGATNPLASAPGTIRGKS
jgi:nucleoside-diphosphate kinase